MILLRYFSIAVLLVFLPCLGRGAELNFEAGHAIIHGETNALGVYFDFHEQRDVGMDHQNFSYECGLTFIDRNGRNASQSMASCLVLDRFSKIDLGVGLAALQHEDQWNSGRINFTAALRYRPTEHWALTYRHFSNAGTRQPNIGRDLLLIGWSF